jgi:hypothetical protein
MNQYTETVFDEKLKITYSFFYGFGFLRAMQKHGLDPQTVWESLRNGKPDVVTVAKTMQCALQTVNDESVNFKSAEKHCEQILNRFGMLEGVTLVSYLLTNSLIGDIKKREISNSNRLRMIAETVFQGLNSKKYMKVGLLWVAACLISGLLGGMISILYSIST